MNCTYHESSLGISRTARLNGLDEDRLTGLVPAEQREPEPFSGLVEGRCDDVAGKLNRGPVPALWEINWLINYNWLINELK